MKKKTQEAKPSPKTQRQKIIGSIIEEVEHYWLTHPFDAISLQGAYTENPVELYKFSRGDHALIPSLVKDQERYEQCLHILGNLFSVENKEANKAWDDLDSLRTQIARDCEHIGYYVGVIMGARLMGAAHAQLEQLGDGLDKYLELLRP
jgi:hypothetical protein